MFTLSDDSPLGGRVCPRAAAPELTALVPRIHRTAWPVWLDPGPRMLRDVLELCRLQTARGLAVLCWLARGEAPADVAWLWPGRRLTGPRQQLMYAAATAVPDPVLGLVVANWTWVLDTRFAGQVVGPYLAGTAYPDDGYTAAQATVTLMRIWERHAEARPALGAAWAACRTVADWCKAAELGAAYGRAAPVFTYPRGPLPPAAAVRPWIARLLRLDT
ncbi:hypothetical protein Sme01_45900 [Sphaerisporangium melleum]|uniref:Uncharacterized protein n=1 Tax=Sphaerisporangium melleum TaxID=321316 RepID=A0A917R024_9ACTN|nr:hypothetical protein [Sphaerisporangium melleum]GGK79924.1 hypothetical protein GCM10007964_23180 [Sphaerisporangium melleum]GII72114.1 hypothetical protein Sme01_45900 [Sphaerisporangium melleum]